MKITFFYFAGAFHFSSGVLWRAKGKSLADVTPHSN